MIVEDLIYELNQLPLDAEVHLLVDKPRDSKWTCAIYKLGDISFNETTDEPSCPEGYRAIYLCAAKEL